MVTKSERLACGTMLRHWRQQRRLSQLALSNATGVSTRHLSCIETGKAAPSRLVLMHLAAELDVPLQERNLLLLAAGYAPSFSAGQLAGSSPTPALAAFERILAAHEPFPALVMNRHWNVVRANQPSVTLTAAAEAAEELRPNALRMALHPLGLAPYVVNFAEWSGHLLTRLRRQLVFNPDPTLTSLYQEVSKYPRVVELPPDATPATGEEVVVLELDLGETQLRLFNTVTVLGAPLDTTLADLVLEAFHPADEATARVLRRG